MSGVLIVIVVVGGLLAIRYVTRQAGRATEKGVMIAGTALGEALRPKEPAVVTGRRGELTVSRMGAYVHQELVESGAVDPSSKILTTPSGVAVRLDARPGMARLICSWDDPTAQPTAILGDVLRTVRQVDDEADVVL